MSLKGGHFGGKKNYDKKKFINNINKASELEAEGGLNTNLGKGSL